MKRQVKLEISVLVPEEIEDKEVVILIDALLNSGLEDAQDSLEEDVGDIESALRVTNLDISSPKLISS